MKIVHVVGARPNYMKVAPMMRALGNYAGKFEQILIHTGQHYNFTMSQIFFQDLNLPGPDFYLKAGSGTHAGQTARVMLAFEPVIQDIEPDLVVVVGDVNSTLACALVCAKLRVSIAHVEAGLRSFDHTMPEEINRLLTDKVANLLFTPSRNADENLLREGIPQERIYFVGNVMIDSLIENITLAQQRDTPSALGLQDRSYVLVTLHRPTNVDQRKGLEGLLRALVKVAKSTAVVFVMHPRTRKRIDEFRLEKYVAGSANFFPLEPQGYLDFLALLNAASVVLTDSGGIQEETTYLGIPCLTLRPNTERPITVECGTNTLVENTEEKIVAAVEVVLNRSGGEHTIPELWDGRTAARIAKVLNGTAL